MALQQYGAISLDNVKTEFTVGTPVVMSDCYRGGAHVTSGMQAPNVPTSGQISLSNFYGADHNLPPPTLTINLNSYLVDEEGQFRDYDYNLGPFTCSVSGGTGPYTYEWTQVGGDMPSSIWDASSYSTYITIHPTTSGDWYGYYKCHVHDSASHEGDSGTLTIHYYLWDS